MAQMYGHGTAKHSGDPHLKIAAALDFTGTLYKDFRNHNIALETEQQLGFTVEEILKSGASKSDLSKLACRLKKFARVAVNDPNFIHYGFDPLLLMEVIDKEGNMSNSFVNAAVQVLYFSEPKDQVDVESTLFQSTIWTLRDQYSLTREDARSNVLYILLVAFLFLVPGLKAYKNLEEAARIEEDLKLT